MRAPTVPGRAILRIARHVVAVANAAIQRGGGRPTRYASHGSSMVQGFTRRGDATRRDRRRAPARPATLRPAGERVKVTIVAANTFQYDARQLRTARALAGDGHQVTLVGFAATGLPARETLDGGIVLLRVPVDLTIASAFRPLPGAARRGLARLLGIPPTATSLPPVTPHGLDRLRAPFRRLAEIAAHARRVGPWSRAVAEATPDARVFHCKALIALPVVRAAARRTGGRFVYDIADIHTEAARLARMPRWFRPSCVVASAAGWPRRPRSWR